MSDHKAVLTEVEDENLNCPYCNALVHDTEAEEWSPPKDCSHFVGCITWEVQEFEADADPKVVEWWTKRQEKAEEADEDCEMSDLVECPHIDHVVEHTSNGMACGPVSFTVSFCFAKEK
jgi:hypothetical protein